MVRSCSGFSSEAGIHFTSCNGVYEQEGKPPLAVLSWKRGSCGTLRRQCVGRWKLNEFARNRQRQRNGNSAELGNNSEDGRRRRLSLETAFYWLYWADRWRGGRDDETEDDLGWAARSCAGTGTGHGRRANNELGKVAWEAFASDTAPSQEMARLDKEESVVAKQELSVPLQRIVTM